MYGLPYNPAYATIFNSKFHSLFERKPTQLPRLAILVSGDLQAVGFKKSDVITSAIPTTPPWLLTRPAVNFTLHCSDKSNTPGSIQTSCPRRGVVKVSTRLVGRIGSGVHVGASFHISFHPCSCASGFRDTLSYHRHHHHRKVC